MGTYLSAPIKDKCVEEGEALKCVCSPVSWGVVDMQGWRKSMEDAHVGQVIQDTPLHLRRGPAMCSSSSSSSSCSCTKVFAVFDGHGGPEVARFCQLYFVSVLTQQETWKQSKQMNNVNSNNNHIRPSETDIGFALRATFHALDRMIDDPSRRDELMRLRTEKPAKGETRDAKTIPLQRAILQHQTSSTFSDNTQNTDDDVPFDEADDENHKDLDTTNTNIQHQTEKKDDDSDVVVGTEQACKMDQNIHDEEHDQEHDDLQDHQQDHQHTNHKHSHNTDSLSIDADCTDTDTGVDAVTEDDVSPTAVKVSAMFHCLLKMSAASAERSKQQRGQLIMSAKTIHAADHFNYNQHGPPTDKAATSPASILSNGRMICNLPDHVVHAGATAICAVLVGKQLTVANAGDSRAVLCRGGAAFPLSFDHKPNHETELTRIQHAGGFVNNFGRVNGNLNLSRSIGDLKYKQVAGLTPAQQMITAEPDIVQIQIDQETDEFLILGCDGIWDCLTNQQAVDYVRSRIQNKKPTDIGREMLDDIISENPRNTQGIGGDNMTLLIVDFKPHSRWYHGTMATATHTGIETETPPGDTMDEP